MISFLFQVKGFAAKQEGGGGMRGPPSAGGIEWEGGGEGGDGDGLKLPDIVGGGIVAQNTGWDAVDFHEQQQQQQIARDKRSHAPRAAPM